MEEASLFADDRHAGAETMANTAKRKERLPVTAGRGLTLLKAAVIVAAAWWVFAPSFHGNWLWDDDLYITANPLLRDGAGLWKIWFEPGSFIEYYPIEDSVLWVQWHLCGQNPLGYHLGTWVLHVVNALLVWWLLGKFRLRWAWLGGLLFAIHPVQVESVAWVAEMKNTLSLLPFLLAMGVWIDYEEGRRRRDYLLALGLFLAAMLCKISMAPFPVVILLYAWWKRGRVGWSEVKASVPFFAISVGLGMMTIVAGNWYREGNYQLVGVVAPGDFFTRLALAGTSLVFYLRQCLWPFVLLPIYPQWKLEPLSLVEFLPWPALGAVIYWCWRKRGTWGRHALLGLGFFLLNLAPLLGIFAASYMNFTWVMDHFLYLPIIGLIGLAVAALGLLDGRVSGPVRLWGKYVVAALMGLLALGSHRYAKRFVNQQSLWSYTLKHNPEAWPAYIDLGKARVDEGRGAEATDLFTKALSINPTSVEGRDDLGNALLQSGRVTEAMTQYEQALSLNPNYAEAHSNLGSALIKTGRVGEAMAQFDEALKLKPADAEIHYNLGVALASLGRTRDAVDQYQLAVSLDPGDAKAHNNLGLMLMQSGQFAQAMEQCEQAVRLEPDFAEACNNLGLVLMQAGRFDDAVAQYEEALRLKPDFVEARSNFGNAYFQVGRMAEAVEQYQEALRLKPGYAEAHNNMGSALQRMGRYAEAVAQYQEALRINPEYAQAQANLAQLQARMKVLPPNKQGASPRH